MYLLGFDIGSSSVKASLINGETGACAASAFYPKQEMKITAARSGWAEQEPELWWNNLKLALTDVLAQSKIDPKAIDSIGISHQMHGLVAVDKNQMVLRPSIIWCDSRATGIGDRAFAGIGEEKCLSNLLNSPGNFTASKLKWVKDNEPDVYAQIDKIMLPGDYIAMKLSGEIKTTAGNLSEGMLWNFKENAVADLLLDYYGFNKSLIPGITPTFSVQSIVGAQAAAETGLAEGTKISYRAGDQPNNALSLNVFNPGEIAATAGTSGVVYGVSGEIKYDPYSRVNTFAHVNHSADTTRLGVLLCINGTGILNSWLNQYVGNKAFSYDEMNQKAASVPIGSEGLNILPFGNGAERVLRNKNIGAQISGLGFNTHTEAHLFRAAQEGIAFSFRYGMDIMEKIGIRPRVIRAGKANMFLSPVFRETLAGVSGATIELYNTDGSVGAARGAGIGSGYYASPREAFASLKKLDTISPDADRKNAYEDAYLIWKNQLEKTL
ncbi:MAG: carbohydrate kinase [Prolixibacteraceae bacterium]|nr:carbohydrate kinase [Prolixibacteraceae bacterium]